MREFGCDETKAGSRHGTVCCGAVRKQASKKKNLNRGNSQAPPTHLAATVASASATGAGAAATKVEAATTAKRAVEVNFMLGKVGGRGLRRMKRVDAKCNVN